MVCLFPMSERVHQAQRPSLLQRHMSFFFFFSGSLDMPDMKYRHRSQPEPNGRSGFGLPQGALVFVRMAFSPLWIAAPLTMDQGCRPASCQAVSTPFSAAAWPTPRSPLRLHALEQQGFVVVGGNTLFDASQVLFQLIIWYLVLVHQSIKKGPKWNSFNKLYETISQERSGKLLNAAILWIKRVSMVCCKKKCK